MTLAMLHEMAARGAGSMVTNVGTRLSLMTVGGRTMPVTVDDGALGGSYVCSPHSAYVLYARAELAIVGAGWLAWPARAALVALDRLLRVAEINAVVHLGNWLLSTNLHDGWRGEGIRDAREAIVARHRRHLVGIRSVDDWASPGLRAALARDGWILVPSRQIWVVDDLAREWRPRNAYGNDRRLVARSPLTITDLPVPDAADARRIAHLYELLYVGRYSSLNPILTPAFVEASARTGMVTYRVARAADGVIMAVAGMWQRSGVMTPPVVGYDTTRPRGEGLYRIACWMFTERAMQMGWRLHASAGAAEFKRLRGARGVIEWNAYHAAHLPRRRRVAIETLAHLLRRAVVPTMVARGW